MSALPADIKPAPYGTSGRTLSTFTQEDKTKGKRILEWSTAPSSQFEAYIARIQQRIPTPADPHREEEARTLTIEGFLTDGARTVLVYKCDEQPTSLRKVLKHVRKFGSDDRRTMAKVIATQVRSLHVHFQVQHLALRAESFVFFLNPYRPNFRKPYMVDWVGAPSMMHQHPEFDAARPAWFYDAWALMMILSEIAEWKPLAEVAGNANVEDLRKRRMERIRMVCSDEWKGPPTASLFRFGFEVLSRERAVLERMDRWEVKKFYDQLCNMFSQW